MAGNTDERPESDNELSEDQVLKLIQYQEITGVENVTEAKELLSQYGWNIEIAVQQHLGVSDIFDSSITTNPPTSQSSAPPPQGVVSRLRLSSIRVLSYFIDWSIYVFKLPIGVAYSSVSSFILFVYRLILPYPRQVTAPVDDVSEFIDEYETTYGVVHPHLYRGSYSQALNLAKSELKFLLIYLHSAKHQDTPQFCRTTLSDSNFIRYTDNTLIFWGCSVTSREGYRVSQALRENSYPFLAMVVLKDNRMSVVARIEGFQRPDSLITNLQNIISNNEAYLVVAKADRDERQLTNMLRQEQDIAFEESLRVDREKARKRQEEIEECNKREQDVKDLKMNQEDKKEEIRRNKIEYADRIPEEPTENSEDVIHIVAKLPNGKRLNRSFDASTSMEGLYYYIFCHPDSPDRFEVTTNFPRKVVPCQPAEDVQIKTFHQFGISANTMLFIVDLDA